MERKTYDFLITFRGLVRARKALVVRSVQADCVIATQRDLRDAAEMVCRKVMPALHADMPVRDALALVVQVDVYHQGRLLRSLVRPEKAAV